MFRTAGHSRLPVYAETLDDPRGMVHIRDFLDYRRQPRRDGQDARRRKMPRRMRPTSARSTCRRRSSAAKILRPVLFVPPSMPALDLLVKMQTLRTHMALVIDEYGGTDGLVSIEDIVEIVVGDIEDEHDEDETPVDRAGRRRHLRRRCAREPRGRRRRRSASTSRTASRPRMSTRWAA